jgi:hypothetical protein
MIGSNRAIAHDESGAGFPVSMLSLDDKMYEPLLVDER